MVHMYSPYLLSLAPYRVMLAVPLLPHEFDFIFRMGYIVGVASDITLLLMPALLGYCRRNGRFSHDGIVQVKLRVVWNLRGATSLRPYADFDMEAREAREADHLSK